MKFRLFPGVVILTVTLLGVIFSREIAQPAHVKSTASRAIVVASDGSRLENIFAGIEPNEQIRALHADARSGRVGCQKESGLIPKLAGVMGLTGTVHAQSSCPGGPCTGCYMSLLAQVCGGYCSAGVFSFTALLAEVRISLTASRMMAL